ncbi:MAG: transposase [Sedimenticola sp.]
MHSISAGAISYDKSRRFRTERLSSPQNRCHIGSRIHIIDPVLFFWMQNFDYPYCIKSDRKLCEEINLNHACRWVCRLNLGDLIPEHSSLTRRSCIVLRESIVRLARCDQPFFCQLILFTYNHFI